MSMHREKTMSRLESHIRRCNAQKLLIDKAQVRLTYIDGVIFELGLGNGRTYDHLRQDFPDREIYVFDRKVASHPSCVPPAERMMLGELTETLPAACERFKDRVALVHTDIGYGTDQFVEEMTVLLGRHLPAALAPGGIVLSDMELFLEGLEEMELPEGVSPGRYFAYWKAT